MFIHTYICMHILILIYFHFDHVSILNSFYLLIFCFYSYFLNFFSIFFLRLFFIYISCLSLFLVLSCFQIRVDSQEISLSRLNSQSYVALKQRTREGPTAALCPSSRALHQSCSRRNVRTCICVKISASVSKYYSPWVVR